MPIEVNSLIKEITTAANNVIQDIGQIATNDLKQMSGFSQDQLTGLAGLSIIVGEGLASGEIPAEDKDFQLNRIKEIAKNFVRTLIGLTLVTIEKIWNAIVGAIWNLFKNVLNLIV